jgi:uncharacterized SAM-binding protein YcdF (DUF218 family)
MMENAVFSKAMVQPKPSERWRLVTSAYHMPRAIGVFRTARFPAAVASSGLPTRLSTVISDVWRPPEFWIGVFDAG